MSTSQEFFATLLPIQKEDEQKFIAYLFHNTDAIHLLPKEAFFDDISSKLYFCISQIISDGLKVEKDILCEYARKVDVERTTIENILNTYTDFSNVLEHTVLKIKHYHVKRKMIGDFDNVVAKGISTGEVDFKSLIEIAEKITEKSYELNDDSRLLTPKQMHERYMQIMIRRQNPEYRRTYGYSCIDKMVMRPAAAEEFTVIEGAKGSGKSLLAKCIENCLINVGTCVSSFNMEMSLESNMDRLISIRGGIPFDIVTQKVDPTEKDLERIKIESERIGQVPNYVYYEEPSLKLSDYDDLLYMAKKRFKDNGVLPPDGYGVSIVDLGSMIEEFSGEDYKGIEKAVNKLSQIYRKHHQHVIFVLQANESQIRNNRRFTTPEQCDNFTLQYEDISGGSAYAARARVIFAVNRPMLLKRRFMPDRNEEWDMEEDIMWVNVVKENDGSGKLGRVPFVFPDSAFRIVPKEFKRERQRVRA